VGGDAEAAAVVGSSMNMMPTVSEFLFLCSMDEKVNNKLYSPLMYALAIASMATYARMCMCG
jgi:hypothetical protein